MSHDTPTTKSLLDSVMIALLLLLPLPVLTSWFTNQLDFLFVESGVGATVYGLIATTSTLYLFIIWHWFKTEIEPGENGWKQKAINALRFIGISRNASSHWYQNIASLMLGPIAAIITVLLIGSTARFMIPYYIPPALLLQLLLIAPIFEEVIFRGLYLNLFIYFFGKNDLSALIGIILSSLVFGYIHADLVSAKTLGGVLLGYIFLYKWRGNVVACMLAHSSANLFLMFVVTVVS
ncbi:MAG: CPBP family intramembrane metalloprotease [Candidatus Bathyarchaeota archaeon]|nr:CPBP family intramembrane metalloprotease [Candidatus Bathyarchaeota archaeon]